MHTSCTFVVDLVWISKVTFFTPGRASSARVYVRRTDSEKIICVRSLQFADSEKFKCINYTVLVLNLCFIKKAPANSSSVVLMRWIMRYSEVTNRFFQVSLSSQKKLSHYICRQLNSSLLWSWALCKRRRFLHTQMWRELLITCFIGL